MTEKMDVRAIKLATGEELIAEITETETGFVAKNPVTIMQNPQTGAASFSPWFAFAQEREFTFLNEQLMFPPMAAGEEIVKNYEHIFNEQIIKTAPEKKIILP